MPVVSSIACTEISITSMSQSDLVFLGEHGERHHFVPSIVFTQPNILSINILYQIYLRDINEKFHSRNNTTFLLTDIEITELRNRSELGLNLLSELTLISYSHSRIFFVDFIREYPNFERQRILYQSIEDLKDTIRQTYSLLF